MKRLFAAGKSMRRCASSIYLSITVLITMRGSLISHINNTVAKKNKSGDTCAEAGRLEKGRLKES